MGLHPPGAISFCIFNLWIHLRKLTTQLKRPLTSRYLIRRRSFATFNGRGHPVFAKRADGRMNGFLLQRTALWCFLIVFMPFEQLQSSVRSRVKFDSAFKISLMRIDNYLWFINWRSFASAALESCSISIGKIVFQVISAVNWFSSATFICISKWNKSLSLIDRCATAELIALKLRWSVDIIQI